jgi:hypothetical protein
VSSVTLPRAMALRPHPVHDVPGLPATITYESVPGRWGYWTATIETSLGRISATRPSLHETRDALESQLRDLQRTTAHKARKANGMDRHKDSA